jgi:hypothetical protein
MYTFLKVFYKITSSCSFHISKFNNLKVIHDLYSQCLAQILSKTSSLFFIKHTCIHVRDNSPQMHTHTGTYQKDTQDNKSTKAPKNKKLQGSPWNLCTPNPPSSGAAGRRRTSCATMPATQGRKELHRQKAFGRAAIDTHPHG